MMATIRLLKSQLSCDAECFGAANSFQSPEHGPCQSTSSFKVFNKRGYHRTQVSKIAHWLYLLMPTTSVLELELMKKTLVFWKLMLSPTVSSTQVTCLIADSLFSSSNIMSAAKSRSVKILFGHYSFRILFVSVYSQGQWWREMGPKCSLAANLWWHQRLCLSSY